MEKRIGDEIKEQEGLLCDMENPVDLKIMPLTHYKETLLFLDKYGLQYTNAEGPLFQDVSFEVCQGERVFLNGVNGCGKTSLFCAILRQLDFESIQFQKPMEEYLEGQKKKILIASSLLTPAHLYLWDEPLNYIDIFSRIQIEKLLKSCRAAMLVVEHDVRFRTEIATKTIELRRFHA